eukprot:3458124-Amphidinium_carterae.1
MPRRGRTLSQSISTCQTQIVQRHVLHQDMQVPFAVVFASAFESSIPLTRVRARRSLQNQCQSTANRTIRSASCAH